MRSWLNGYGAEMNRDGKDYSDNNFLDNAFSTGEQSAIKITNVVDDAVYGTEGGNGTTDKVYLLSIDEVTNPEYGFISSVSGTNTRQAVNIAHTAADLWWLRSPGLRSDYASYMFRDGSVENGVWYFTVYIVHTVKKDEYMEQYTQTIGKNVYTVRGKFGYLIVRKEDLLSVFLLQ